MPGRPQNHRVEWSKEELAKLRQEVRFLVDSGRSVKQACTTLRYTFRRKPCAMESAYYRLERSASAPKVELLHAVTGPVVSGATVEALLKGLNEAGVDLSDTAKLTIIKGKQVALKSQTVHSVEEV